MTTCEQIMEHLPLVRRVMEYRNSRRLAQVASLQWVDIEAMGIAGLWHAIERYDPASGNKFSTYAWKCIDGYILSGVRAHRYGAASRGSAAWRKDFLSAVKLQGDTMEWCVGLVDPEPDVAHEQACANERVDILNEAIDSLPDRQRIAVRGRLRGRKLADIGKEIGCSGERVRQLHEQAILSLRTTLEERGLTA